MRAALDARNPLEAVRACQERLGGSPEEPEAHRHLGVLYAASDESVRALRHGRRACGLRPDDPRSWRSRSHSRAARTRLFLPDEDIEVRPMLDVPLSEPRVGWMEALRLGESYMAEQASVSGLSVHRPWRLIYRRETGT